MSSSAHQRPPPTLTSIPFDLHLEIAKCLSFKDLGRLIRTTKLLSPLSKSEYLWKHKACVDYRLPSNLTNRTTEWKKICKGLVRPVLLTWGETQQNRLGRSYSEHPSTKPGVVTGPWGAGIVSIACAGWDEIYGYQEVDRPSYKVNIPDGHNGLTIGAGHRSKMALTTDGTLYYWDENVVSESDGVGVVECFMAATPVGERLVRITATENIIAALTASGNVYTTRDIQSPNWQLESVLSGSQPTLITGSMSNLMGYTAPGQCTIINTHRMEDVTPPTLRQAESSPTSPVVQVVAGDWHFGALRADGTVWTWGEAGAGARGDGQRYGSVHTPTKIVEGFEGLFVFQLAMGGWHSAALAVIVDEKEWAKRMPVTVDQVEHIDTAGSIP
ncbi:hypothetical protein HDV00_005832 [Rhizophlyctis rosea]|nr:hypothetical protein HDV00_005832 [Rhizophlyctis rosea]